MKTAKITAALAILVVLFIFSVNNYQPVAIAFLGYRSPAMPLFLIILFMFVLGGMLTGLIAAIRFSQLHRRNLLLQKEIDTLTKSLGAQREKVSESDSAAS